jgi:hypothetical protein
MREEESNPSMNYREWLEKVPELITGNPLWKPEACRLALFAADLGWRDATKLMRDKRTFRWRASFTKPSVPTPTPRWLTF